MFTLKVDDEIELGLLELRHAEPLFALVHSNRSYLRQWLPWVDATASSKDTLGFIQQMLRAFAEQTDLAAGILFAGQLAGTIGMHAISRINRSADIGYWLSSVHQGQGIVTRACRALIDYGFKELNLNRIEIRCAVGNLKSRGIPERLGFTPEGTVREAEWLYDHFEDHAIYGMLTREWVAGPEVSA